MTYLLDTNACIRYLNHRSTEVARRLKQHSLSEIALCSVVKAELFYGAAKSRHPNETLARQREFVECFSSFAFDDDAAEQYANIRASLERKGTPIGPNDLMIAAIAMANGLILVTANSREFMNIEGLRIENWEE